MRCIRGCWAAELHKLMISQDEAVADAVQREALNKDAAAQLARFSGMDKGLPSLASDDISCAAGHEQGCRIPSAPSPASCSWGPQQTLETREKNSARLPRPPALASSLRRRSRAGLSDPQRPIASFMFLGPTADTPQRKKTCTPSKSPSSDNLRCPAGRGQGCRIPSAPSPASCSWGPREWARRSLREPWPCTCSTPRGPWCAWT